MLNQQRRPRLRLRLNPDHRLLKEEPRMMLAGRKERIEERRIEGQIEGVTMHRETEYRAKL